MSGFVGVTYPDDLPSQRALFTPLLEPIVTQLLGVGTTFELHPRRGVVKNGTLPPVEVYLFFSLPYILWFVLVYLFCTRLSLLPNSWPLGSGPRVPVYLEPRLRGWPIYILILH